MSVILHIPHSSTEIPDQIRPQLVLSDDELSHELLLMTDHFTEHLFSKSIVGAEEVIFPVSRLVVDPERFPDDGNESMAQVGMGAVYERTSNGQQLRRDLSSVEREKLLDDYYRPHHRLLSTATENALARRENCLIVDCHSFPSRPLPYEFDQSPIRPDICIGTDSFHTSKKLESIAVRAFRTANLSVEVNRPFEGALVPLQYFQSTPTVQAIMVEVNRSLYMDEEAGTKLKMFDEFRRVLGRCLTEVVGEVYG